MQGSSCPSHGEASAEEGTTCSIQELDDASLCAVFSCLTASELATAALVCASFRTASQSNPLWLQLVRQDFGIEVALTADIEPAAAAVLYRRLLGGSSRPRALPCRAVCTDGGCDEPNSSTFWVSAVCKLIVAPNWHVQHV
jgi:hypothetical protein